MDKKVDARYRNFGTVVYPDSAPDDWMEIVSSYHVPAFISPIHDSDLNPVGNEHKKDHFHVMFMYEGKKVVPRLRKSFLPSVVMDVK